MTQMLLTFFLLISSCSSTGVKNNNEHALEPAKVLIVYLSRTNNTKAVAEMIHKKVGGTLVALELEKPYPENYQAIVKQVAEENESGYLPPLKTRIDSMQNYDVIFVGFPTWGMQLPPPMKSFLNQYDLSGKTVIPFNTNAGYGIGSSFQTVKELCPNSTILEGFSAKGGVERDGIYFVMEGEKEKEIETKVRQWIQKIKITAGSHTASAQKKEMMIRISEIEIDSAYLEDYKAILKEEAAASVKLEPGVIAIFPMYQKENPSQIRILEMYADKSAYEQHLKTPHFQKYKTTTLKMVKSLKLVDMEAIDAATMRLMFQKLNK